MPSHRSPDEIAELRSQAAALRAAGIGAKRIAQQLGIPYHLAQTLLRGVPVPASLMRLRAKDDLREAAIALRREGRTYPEIQEELGVSKGSLSLWLRELAHPTEEQRESVRSGTTAEPLLDVQPDAEIARALRADGWLLREIADELARDPMTVQRWCRGVPVPARAVHGRSAEETAEMGRAYWAAERTRRAAVRSTQVGDHADRVGGVSERELALLAAVAYWCEGGKSKPWRRLDRLVFINSDPDLIRLFVAWLEHREVPLGRCRLSLSIHESGDVDAATRFWADVLGVATSAFAKPSLKRHNPKTVRKNTGDHYVGCLIVAVRGSRDLYREIEGLWHGIVRGLNGRDPRVRQTDWGQVDM